MPERTQLRELRHRLSLAPHNTALRLRLAQWLAEHGRRNEALEELRTLVRLDPNHLEARKLREELARGSKTAKPAPSLHTSEALH
ncbi:MAG: tetratricopeptide repeat protein [Bryobacterales bacterium]